MPVHVAPTYGRKHVTDDVTECWCGPAIELHHPETGRVYEVPLIVHREPAS